MVVNEPLGLKFLSSLSVLKSRKQLLEESCLWCHSQRVWVTDQPLLTRLRLTKNCSVGLSVTYICIIFTALSERSVATVTTTLGQSPFLSDLLIWFKQQLIITRT